jgi:hypothetical protein
VCPAGVDDLTTSLAKSLSAPGNGACNGDEGDRRPIDRNASSSPGTEGEGAFAMNSRFDDIWRRAAADGASAFTGMGLPRSEPGADLDELLDAWYRERTDRIEC